MAERAVDFVLYRFYKVTFFFWTSVSRADYRDVHSFLALNSDIIRSSLVSERQKLSVLRTGHGRNVTDWFYLCGADF